MIYQPFPGHNWYITVKNGTLRGVLLGPFNSPFVAMGLCDVAQAMAEEADGWACFYTYHVNFLRTEKRGIFMDKWEQGK